MCVLCTLCTLHRYSCAVWYMAYIRSRCVSFNVYKHDHAFEACVCERVWLAYVEVIHMTTRVYTLTKLSLRTCPTSKHVRTHAPPTHRPPRAHTHATSERVKTDRYYVAGELSMLNTGAERRTFRKCDWPNLQIARAHRRITARLFGRASGWEIYVIVGESTL